MLKASSCARAVVLAALLMPAVAAAAEPRPTVRIVGEVTISFGADGSMVVKAGNGATTTLDYSGAAAAPAVAPAAMKKAPPAASASKPVVLEDTPIATSPIRPASLRLAPTASGSGAGGGQPAPDPPAAGQLTPEEEKAAEKTRVVTTTETTETTETDATGKQTKNTKIEDVKTAKVDKDSDVTKDLYAGTGAMIRANLGSRRADAIKFVTRKDGEILAQIQKSENVDVGIGVETHYLLKNMSVFEGNDGKGVGELAFGFLGKILACGPFALSTNVSKEVVGCGPLFTAVLDKDAKIDQFGIGWALGLGKKDGNEKRANFGVGFGLMFDTDAKVVDRRIIDTDTMLVRPNFKDQVTSGAIGGAGGISPLVTRPSVSTFLMVSKTF